VEDRRRRARSTGAAEDPGEVDVRDELAGPVGHGREWRHRGVLSGDLHVLTGLEALAVELEV
jgi:hypothetical protein